MGVIIAIVNTKGGSCKSTSAMAIAGDLIRRGYKTVLADLDPQATCTKFYKAKTDGVATMMDVWFPDEREPITIDELIQNTNRGMIIPSDTALKHKIKEATTLTHLNAPKKFMKSYLKNNYDFCIVDTAGAPGPAVTSSLILADYVIISTIPSKSNIFEVGDTIKDIVEVINYQNENLKWLGVLICNGKENGLVTNAAREFLTREMSKQGTFVFNTIVRTSQDIAKAENFDRDINDFCNEPKKNFCKYKKLTSKEKQLFANADPINIAASILDRITIAKKIHTNCILITCVDNYEISWKAISGCKIIDNILIPNKTRKKTEKIELEAEISVLGTSKKKKFTCDCKEDNVGYDYQDVTDEILLRINEEI